MTGLRNRASPPSLLKYDCCVQLYLCLDIASMHTKDGFRYTNGRGDYENPVLGFGTQLFDPLVAPHMFSTRYFAE
jgi:hypothetical protein